MTEASSRLNDQSIITNSAEKPPFNQLLHNYERTLFCDPTIDHTKEINYYAASSILCKNINESVLSACKKAINYFDHRPLEIGETLQSICSRYIEIQQKSTYKACENIIELHQTSKLSLAKETIAICADYILSDFLNNWFYSWLDDQFSRESVCTEAVAFSDAHNLPLEEGVWYKCSGYID